MTMVLAPAKGIVRTLPQPGSPGVPPETLPSIGLDVAAGPDGLIVGAPLAGIVRDITEDYAEVHTPEGTTIRVGFGSASGTRHVVLRQSVAAGQPLVSFPAEEYPERLVLSIVEGLRNSVAALAVEGTTINAGDALLDVR